MQRIPLKGGDEYDILTNARKYYKYAGRAGVCKKVKKQYNKRYRRLFKKSVDSGDYMDI